MKVQWCWRCKKNVPMFNEEEYEIISKLYTDGLVVSKSYMKQQNAPVNQIPFSELYCLLIDTHEKMTGVRETNHDEIRKHRILDYGPPCPSCGKILRTPNAGKCFECGFVVS